ncbi:MAG: DUF6036 family nucleotidyltransferase [Coriobacteriales bacterium]
MQIDEEVLLELGVPSERYRIVVVGGSALVLSSLTTRPATRDIDVLETDVRIQEILNRYAMVNSRVSAYADEIPFGFEDRLVEIALDTRAVQYFRPSVEDLAVMKLYALRPNDLSDLKSPEFLARIDWVTLRHLVYDPDEAPASALSERRWREMADSFERYERGWRNA